MIIRYQHLLLTLISILLCLFVETVACGSADAQKYGRPVIPANPNFLRQQAFDGYLNGDYEDAAILYKKAIEAGKSQYGENSAFVADLYYELGTMSLEEGNFTRASIYLPKAVNLKPNSVMARVKLADLYLMQDKTDEAFGQIGLALKRNPGSVEARKELVKLMMARAKSSGHNSEAANLACTWEAFQLKQFSNTLIKNTNSLIAHWKNQINGGKKKLPTLRVAVAVPRTRRVPKTQGALKIKPPQKKAEVVKPKPKAKPKKIKPKPKAKVKPKPKKTRPKPKPKTVTKKTTKVKPPTRRRARKGRSGLVPPPPPTVPVYAPPPTNIKLETKAKVKKKPKKKPKKKKVRKPSIPDEPDFILDWASSKKKKKKAK